jgi:hypothetical protein
VATGPGPIFLAATGESIWVELHRADQVARIDPIANEQVEITDTPVHCGLASSGEDVWATNHALGLVTRMAATDGTSETFDVPDACGVAVDGDTAWVTSPAEGSVYVLQAGTAEPTRRIDVATMIFDIALDEASAWVASESDGGTLWQIDRSTYEVTRAGEFPGVDAAELALGSLWLTSRPLGHLWKLDPDDGSLLAELNLEQPSGVVAVGDSLWLTLYNGRLLQLDPGTLAVLSDEQLQFGYLGPPIHAFGSLWTAALEDDVLLRVTLD